MHSSQCRYNEPTVCSWPILLQKSKVVEPLIFRENTKRETIAGTYALTRVADVACEFNVRGCLPSRLYTKDAPTAHRIFDHRCKTTFATVSAHHIISWRRSNSVAFGAKRTSAAAVRRIGFMSTRPSYGVCSSSPVVFFRIARGVTRLLSLQKKNQKEFQKKNFAKKDRVGVSCWGAGARFAPRYRQRILSF